MTAFEELATIKELHAFHAHGFVTGMELSYFADDMLYLGQLVLPDDSYHEVTRVERILVLRELLKIALDYIARTDFAPPTIHPQYRRDY